MTNETKEAIRGSIAKWEAIVDGSGIDKGRGNCPLCIMYFQNNCLGCPISHKTGKSYCDDTPIAVWRELTTKHFDNGETRYYPKSPISMDIAKTVVQFLKNLMPN